MDSFRPVKASKVIAAIQKLIDEHGDVPMVLEDPDPEFTLWLPIGIHFNGELIMVTSDVVCEDGVQGLVK